MNRVQNEEKVEVGEMFYTTGEDRVFPKGLPVGKVVSVQPGPTFKLIDVVPAGTANGLTEEVLIVLEGVHQDVPPPNAVAEKIQLSPAPPLTKDSSINSMPISGGANGQMVTDADKTVEKYRALEQSRGATFGAYGSQAPSFSSIPSLPVRQPQGLLPQEPKADATAADSPPASSIPPIPPKKQ